MPAAVADYRDRFGFAARHAEEGFAVLVRDEAILHLWAAGDGRWRERPDLVARPIASGAESFLAGTASCRIEVADVDALFAELAARGALHPTSEAGPKQTDFGTREFACLDLTGNLVEFFRWEPALTATPSRLPTEVRLPGPLRVEIRLGAEETGGAFCLALDHPLPGWGLPPHRHAGESETIHVLEGRFASTVDGVTTELGPGDTVHVPQGVEHSGALLGDVPGRRLLLFAPAGMEAFFLAAGAARDPGDLPRIAAEHGWRFSPG